jgi:hypothetical protein
MSRTWVHYRTFLALKSLSAVHEVYGIAYSDKEVPNKTTIHKLETIFRDRGSVYDRKHVQSQTALPGVKLFC